jgi:hypothetical protein
VSPGWPNGETHLGVMPQGLLFTQQSEPGELKHLSTRRRRNQHWAQARGAWERSHALEITRVAASETVRSLNRSPCEAGVVGPTDGSSEAT